MKYPTWMSRLSNSRITLVLCLLVAFTTLQAALLGGLRWQIESKLSHISRPAEGPKTYTQSGEPEQNAAPYYQAAIGLLGPKAAGVLDSHDIGRYRAEHPEEVAKTLKTFQPCLALLEQAHGQPYSNFQIRYANLMDRPSLNYLGMRQLVRLLCASVEVHGAARQWPQACQRATQGLRFVRTLEPCDSLIMVVVRMNLSEELTKAIAGIPAAERSPELHQELTLLRTELGAAFDQAIANENRFAAATYDSLCKDSTQLSLVDAGREQPWHLPRWAYRAGGEVLIRMDELNYLNWYEGMLSDLKSGRHNQRGEAFWSLTNYLSFNGSDLHERLQKQLKELGEL